MARIFNYYRKSISGKLLTFFLLTALVPVIMVGTLSFFNAKNGLQELIYSELHIIEEAKISSLNTYIENRFVPLNVLAHSNDALEAFYKLQDYHEQFKISDGGEYNVNTPQYKQIDEQFRPFFETFASEFSFDDLYFVCAEHGHVMFSVEQLDDLGTNLRTGKLKNTHLADAWSRVIETEDDILTDMQVYPISGESEMFLGHPMYNKNEELVAVIILRIHKDGINNIMLAGNEASKSMESYLVGQDNYMRSDSRFLKESTTNIQKVESESTRRAFNKEEGFVDIIDYRGMEVISLYDHIDWRNKYGANFEWAIVSEIDKKEAYHEVYVLRRNVLIFGLLVVVIVVLFSLMIASRFSKPIKEVTKVATYVARGDLSHSMNVQRDDEIGILAESFRNVQKMLTEKVKEANEIANGNLTIVPQKLSESDMLGAAFTKMVLSLQNQTMKINEVVVTLSSANSQLVSTIAQLSSSSNETATTVSEITTTIEEVKQTAELSAQKAKNVAQTAQKSVSFSEMGIKATEESIAGMQSIQGQVNVIAETIVKLSEQSQTIGEITDSVNDLAEQSNLLAVNASIEAVKAGEYGKGFGVLAQEIRALADQSKQATIQIRGILTDVTKSISAAVMATEQGGKAVENGVKLAESSGDTISVLADNIAEATQASSQIAASSQQQLTGMEQLAGAMENIKLAASQNADGAKQAEEAVTSLKKIVSNLSEIIEQYNL